MIKILDLFAGTQSTRKSFDYIENWENKDFIWNGYKNGILEVQYAGVDIYSPEFKNLHLDLSQDDVVEKLKEKLGNWTPNFVWASPICNKFSMVLTGAGGNYYYEVKDDNIIPRENWNIKVQPHMEKYNNEEGREKARKDAELAMVLHNNTKKIIDYFGVPFAIENPASALTKYIYKDYERSVAHYCMYGFDYKKPTAIYTNKKLELKQCDRGHLPHATMIGEKHKPKPSHWLRGNSTYANRSSVPAKLIKDIIKQLTKKEEN